jgi:hypothetical protein
MDLDILLKLLSPPITFLELVFGIGNKGLEMQNLFLGTLKVGGLHLLELINFELLGIYLSP